MAINFLSSIDITGTASLSSVSNDNSSYTGILVWDGGLLKYRTKSQLLTDIGGDINNYVSSISFNTTNGILSLPRTGLSTLTVDLDGRYALASDNVDGSGTTNFVAKWLDSNTIQDSVIFDNGTNVGIGTTSPQEKLDVKGALRVDSELSSNNIVINGGDSGNLATITSRGNGISIATGTDFGTTHIKLLPGGSGNVGIGTTSPGQKLEVALGTSSGSDGIFIKGYFAGGSSYIDSKKPFISLGTSTSNTYTSTIYLGASATATDQDSKIEWSKTNNALSIYHKGQGTYKEHVRFGDPSSSIAKSVFFGNVGIGVTSPSATLDVNTGGLAAKFVSTQTTALEVQGGANAQDIARFKNTGGNVQFVINNGGDVGIGVASPSTKLEVAGNILANATNATVNIGSTISSTPAYGYASTGAGTIIVGGYTNSGYSYQPGVMTLINQNPGIGAGADLGVIQFAGKDDATSGYVSTIIKAFTAAGAGSGNSGGGILTISTTPGYGSPIERFRINQNGNIGIGTSSPSARLDVNTGGMAAKFVSTQNTGLSVQGGANSQDLAIFKNPGGITELVIKSTGNVGIGNNFNTPSERLEVSGGNLKVSNTGTPTLILNSTNSTGAKIQALKNGSTSPAMGELAWNSSTGINLSFFTALTALNSLKLDGSNFIVTNNGSERMRINSSGNVGIGTTSPSQKLDVEGNVIIRPLNTTDTISFLNLGSNQSRLVTTNNFAIFNGSIETARFLTTGGFKLAEYGSGTFTGTATQRLGVTSTGDVIEIPIGSGAVDGSGTTNFVTKWIDGDTVGDSVIFDNGTNVGIGTASPGEKLEVAGNVKLNSGALIISGTPAGQGAQTRYISGVATTNDLWFNVPTNGRYRFAIADSQAVEITSSGNVGIGTTSPSNKLHVVGSQRIDQSADWDGLNIYGFDNQSSDYIKLHIGTTPMARYQSNLTHSFYVGNSRNLDIAATAIAFKVNTSYSDDLISIFGNNKDSYIGYSNTDNRLKIGFGSLSVPTVDSNTKLSLDASGVYVTDNLGIGTTSPSQKLEVAGAIPKIYINSSNNTGGSILFDDNLSTGTEIQGTQGNVIFKQSGSEKMRITSSGNLGIGTTTPSQKLDVNGNVQADTLIATDLTDGVIPYHRNNSLGLQDQKMFSDNTNIYIGPSSPPNYYSRLTVEGSGIYTTDIEISGSLTYQEPTAASEFNGEIATFGTFIETPAAGDLICFNNSLGTSGWREANNSSNVDSTGMLGIAIGTTPTSGILLRGFARSALYNTTNLGTTPAGKKLYIDSTNGLLTTVIPTSNYVRIVGYVVEADATDGTIYFCPDNTYIDI